MRFLRLGPSGIRGAVGSALTAQLAIKYASAFGTWLDGGTVGVAIDTRTSSPMFKSPGFSRRAAMSSTSESAPLRFSILP